MHIPLKRVQMSDITAVKRIPEARKRKIKKKIREILRGLGRKRYDKGEKGMIKEKRGTDGSRRIHFCNLHEGPAHDRYCIAFYMQCNAKADVLHIRTVFCARIQGNQGAPRVHRARAQQQVNKSKKFFCTNLYEFCMFCEGILILLKNKL